MSMSFGKIYPTNINWCGDASKVRRGPVSA